MSIDLDPNFIRSLRGRIPRAAILALAALTALPGAGLVGWFLYCDYFSGSPLGVHGLELDQPVVIELAPEMNPIGVIVGTGRSIFEGEHRYVLDAFHDPGGEPVWSERFTLEQKKSRERTGVRIGSKVPELSSALALAALRVEEAGPHTFLLRQRTIDRKVGNNDVHLVLRGNARTFPLLYGILGGLLLMIGVGAFGIGWPAEPPEPRAEGGGD